MSANNNDIYLIWNHSLALRLRHRDFAPLTPQNTSISASASNHPLLQWDSNIEADIDFYRIYKRNALFQYVEYGTSTTNSFEDTNEEVAGEPGANQYLVYYKITAVDLEDNESPQTDPLSIIVQGSPQAKMADNSTTDNLITHPQLIGNYPNPFNPSTEIRFALPQESQVSLDVYDIHGRLVRRLVNAPFSSGVHDINWDGQDQYGQFVTSGIYVYTLQTGAFKQSGKMIMMK